MATERDITIDQGAVYLEAYQLKDGTGTPINLTGAAIRAQIRSKPGSAVLVAQFDVVITDAPNGKFTLGMTPDETARVAPKDYAYDLFVKFSNANIEKLITGVATITPRVTLVTNLIDASENLADASWDKTVTLTGGQLDPWGGTSAFLVEDTSAANEQYVLATVNAEIQDRMAFSLHVKAGNAVQSEVEILDDMTGDDRALFYILWAGGVPSLNAGLSTGVLNPTIVKDANGFYRIGFEMTGCINGNDNLLIFYPSVGNPESPAALGKVTVAGFQFEPNSVTDYVRTP